MAIPDIPDVLTADEITHSAEHLANLQQPSGMIPWFPGGHCDPWNHVESAMALDVAGFHREAEQAYGWLADIQREDGAWHNYYVPDGDRDNTVEDTKLDTNVTAYIATGIWHHYLCTGDRSFVDNMWPTLEAAITWVLSMRRPDGLPLWAIEPDERPWEYALLTGCASIQHALRCGAAVAEATGTPRPEWSAASEQIVHMVANHPDAFEPKERWAMDWYYPVLTGAIVGEPAIELLERDWEKFAFADLGVRCVTDEPWVTASETAECAIAFAAAGLMTNATELLATTRRHRLDSGAYLTGIVYPDGIIFPDGEHSSYTAAAVILAADAITGASPAAKIFAAPRVRSTPVAPAAACAGSPPHTH